MSKKGKYLAVGIGVVVALLLLWVYQESNQRKALENIEISLEKVELAKISISESSFEITFNMFNPNDIKAILDKADFEIYLNQNNFGNGTVLEKYEILPHGSQTVKTEFTVRHEDAIMSSISIIHDSKIEILIIGTAHYETIFGEIDVPFRFSKLIE